MGRLEELLNKLASAESEQESEKKQEEEFVKLSEEELKMLEGLGAAYVQGIVDGYLTKLAEDEMAEEEEEEEISPEDVVEEIVSMVEEGEITPEEAEAVLNELADNMEKTAGVKEYFAGAADMLDTATPNFIKSLASILSGKRLISEWNEWASARRKLNQGVSIREFFKRLRGDHGTLKALSRFMAPALLYGGLAAGAGYGANKLLSNRKKKKK